MRKKEVRNNSNKSMEQYRQVIVTNEMHKRLEEEKERTDMSYREIVEIALEEYFEKHKPVEKVKKKFYY